MGASSGAGSGRRISGALGTGGSCSSINTRRNAKAPTIESTREGSRKGRSSNIDADVTPVSSENDRKVPDNMPDTSPRIYTIELARSTNEY